MAALTGRSQAEGSVLAVLLEQHARVRELLCAVRSFDGDARADSFHALRSLLAAHETAEEIVLRPVSVQVMSRDEVTARNHEEHRIIGLLAELERLDSLSGASFDALFARFAEFVGEHLAQEESSEFPVIETEVDGREQLAMGRWMHRALVLAPTRAHPVAAGHPAAQRVTAPFASLADHARDLLERTRSHRSAAAHSGMDETTRS